MAVVARLSTAAVKGTALEHPDEVALVEQGARGDRTAHLIDERGRLVNAKQAPALTTVRSRLAGGELVLALPGGETVAGPLEVTSEQVTTGFYGRPVPGRIVAGPFAEALSAVVGRSVRLVRPERVAAVDAAPVSLVSGATLEALRIASGGPSSGWADRFRILIEIDGVEPREEETWQGQHVAAGEAVIEVTTPITRCAVTTLDPATGSADHDTLGALRSWRADGTVTLGMKGEVVQPGRIARGDVLQSRQRSSRIR